LTFARIGRALAAAAADDARRISTGFQRESFGPRQIGVWRFAVWVRKNEYRLLRYGPMAIADLAAEWFETEQLRAIIAARGIFGAFAGPWSAARAQPSAASRDRRMHDPTFDVRQRRHGFAVAGLAKVATEAGAEIRTNAEVASVSVKMAKPPESS